MAIDCKCGNLGNNTCALLMQLLIKYPNIHQLSGQYFAREFLVQKLSFCTESKMKMEKLKKLVYKKQYKYKREAVQFVKTCCADIEKNEGKDRKTNARKMLRIDS